MTRKIKKADIQKIAKRFTWLWLILLYVIAISFTVEEKTIPLTIGFVSGIIVYFFLGNAYLYQLYLKTKVKQQKVASS